MQLSGILIGSEDPQRLAEYYAKVLGVTGTDDGGYTGFDIGGAWVSVGPHSEVHGRNADPGRLIWNLEAADVRAEFERMRDAGATVVREPYTPEGTPQEMAGFLIATFEDPDGNYFQLMSPMEMP
jgi:predicted enzyme related to lactoylglutathione lyase